LAMIVTGGLMSNGGGDDGRGAKSLISWKAWISIARQGKQKAEGGGFMG